MNGLEERYIEYGVVRGGLLFLRPKDALSLVQEAKRERIAVLGIDGFSIFGNKTQPLMEKSIDLSTDSTGCWSKAEEFITSHIDESIYFEVVLDR